MYLTPAKMARSSDAELQSNRRAQDRVMAERHDGFGSAAKDQTMKYERASFAVGGEGSKESSLLFRRNYSLIQWEEPDGIEYSLGLTKRDPTGDSTAD